MSAKILNYNPNFPGAGEPGVFLSLFSQVSSGQCKQFVFFCFFFQQSVRGDEILKEMCECFQKCLSIKCFGSFLSKTCCALLFSYENFLKMRK